MDKLIAIGKGLLMLWMGLPALWYLKLYMENQNLH